MKTENTVNSYRKFCANTFAAKCPQQHERGEIITLTTKYGKEHDNEVHNYLGKTNDGFYLYSITRADGFNAQERAQRKADKLSGYAENAEKRSDEAYNSRGSKHELDFMKLGEPIKIGHHSERRHRKLFKKYDNKMRKSIQETEKAEEYARRAEYWESKTSEINLSMPESLEFFEYKLEQAKEKHKFLKNNPDKRAHGYSLTYANKEVKETEKNLNLAVKLWGTEEQIQQVNSEKKEKAEAKASKSKKMDAAIKEHGGFFAFNNAQLKEGYAKNLEDEHVEEGEKVRHIQHGLYIPSKNVDAFLKSI